MRSLLLFLLFGLAHCVAAEPIVTLRSSKLSHEIATLTNPAKLDKLDGRREATPLLREAMYWLWTGKQEGLNPGDLIDAAQEKNGAKDTERGKILKSALLRNLDILEKLGCLNTAGADKLRSGNAPTITEGPYAGELATVDHIIPRSVVPELDNVMINLEFLPDTLNRRKGNTVTERQIQLARKWHKAGEHNTYAQSVRFLVNKPATQNLGRSGLDSSDQACHTCCHIVTAPYRSWVCDM